MTHTEALGQMSAERPNATALVRYVGEDLVLTEEPDRLTIAIPASPGPDVTYVLSD